MTFPLFSSESTCTPRCLPSFPTRRSSDLFHCTVLPTRLPPPLAELKLVPAGTAMLNTAAGAVMPLGEPKSTRQNSTPQITTDAVLWSRQRNNEGAALTTTSLVAEAPPPL